MKKIITNIALFQLGWFCCVLAAANYMPLAGTAAAMMVVLWHLASSYDPRKELTLLLMAALIGTTWESLLVSAGWLQYPSGTFITGMAPIWIIAMWMLFATTLNVSLRWLKNRLALAAALGATAGPVAFYTGYRLGGVNMPDITIALLALAVGWSVLMPLLMTLSNRLDGTRPNLALAGIHGWNTHA
jgi:hypothetical protein